MKKLLTLIAIGLLAILGVYIAKRGDDSFGHKAIPPTITANRVVSLAPSVTEVLFAIGAGPKVVGVTRYCDYPPEAKTRTQVGGYLDPSYEAVVRLKPDLVVVTSGSNDNSKRLADLGIRTLTVDHNTIGGIVQSITDIGKAVGESGRANQLVADLQLRMKRVVQLTQSHPKPSVLVVVGRSMGGTVDEVYAAGKGNFYDEMIDLAGGKNAFTDRLVKVPTLSNEGITRLNPEVIIDLEPLKPDSEAKALRGAWSPLAHVAAVKQGRVNILRGSYVVIPGPRVINTLEDMAKAIHPEVDWGRQ